MRFFVLAVVLTALTLNLTGCGKPASSQAASASQLEQYLRDNPVPVADDSYDVD